MGFQELFYPAGVAVFGSVGTGKIANQIITQLTTAHFPHIYAVNPKAQGLENVSGYARLHDITDKVDLAVIAAPAATVASILEDCGTCGVKAAVVISSGFGETGNLTGELELKAIAARYGIRFIGPNCAGLVNTAANLVATIEVSPPAGHTAIISQSGAVGGTLMALAHANCLGISKFISYGNGADISMIEFLRYLKDDADTKVIGLYIENVENGREFMAALKELTAVKPVIVIKSGRTDTGQRATLSHTGSMAGSDAVYDAALRECGALRVDTIDDMIDLCKGFAYLPPLKGRKVGVVTNSGGPGVMAADKASKLNLDLTETQPNIIAKLQEFLVPHAGYRNPIDMTVESSGSNYYKTTCALMEQYDAVINLFIGTPFLDTVEIADAVLLAARACAKPVVSVLQSGAYLPRCIKYLQENGVPNFPSPERAMQVLAYMAQDNEYRSSLATSGTVEIAGEQGRIFKQGNLSEPQVMSILARHGLPVLPYRFVQKREQLTAACLELTFPLVMKVVSGEIIHKSEVGGVCLNLQNAVEAEQAFDKIMGLGENYAVQGVMLYPMCDTGHEVLLGLIRDAQFGPVVVFGLGGIYTEILQDTVMRIAPVSQQTARQMIDEIKAAKLLTGVRGETGCDLTALASLIAEFSQLPFYYPDLDEADLNPIIINSTSISIADARLLKN